MFKERENTQVTMQQLAQVLAVNQDDILESIDNLQETQSLLLERLAAGL